MTDFHRVRLAPAGRALAVSLLALLPAHRAEAQRGAWIRPMAYGIPGLVHSTLAAPGRSVGEVRIAQPMLMARGGAFGGRARLAATLNLEGLTIPDGEITPGAWGEGFVDRRHPHTYLHELVLWGDDALGRLDGPLRLSWAVGKGFVPFGTDDPMTRPFERYPVNHHLAQVIERAMAAGGARLGPVAVEAALFNGDEPERPGEWPRISHRFGDSWAARLTLFPMAGLELQGSHAFVNSPEHRGGSGLDQSKWSGSARWEGPLAGQPLYGFVEWERSSEASGFYVFRSVLAEAAWRRGPVRVGYRFERTERPEEERTASRWRSPRPLLDNGILATTRWTIHTAMADLNLLRAKAAGQVAPFIEVSYGSVALARPAAFDPAAFYGQDHFWSLTLGVRLAWHGRMARMGRYGVVATPAPVGPGLNALGAALP